MEIRDDLLEPGERTTLRLRQLYSENGYTPYRMSKFEEYDLYAGNKDFLVSDNVRVERADVVDTGFAWSDHNPVVLSFFLEGTAGQD